jgi:hypothetical protein
MTETQELDFLLSPEFDPFRHIIENAEDGYIDLPYHNWSGHILWCAKQIPKAHNWAIENGITDIPLVPLTLVTFKHDVDLYIPLEEKLTASDEAYSALILGNDLIRFPEGREIWGMSTRGIIDSTPHMTPKDNFGLMFRRIDTSNVCSPDFDFVLENSLDVMYEEEVVLKNRKTESYEEKIDKISKFLAAFYYPGVVEFKSEDGYTIPYEPALVGAENVVRLANTSKAEFIRRVPRADELFNEIWDKAA